MSEVKNDIDTIRRRAIQMITTFNRTRAQAKKLILENDERKGGLDFTGLINHLSALESEIRGILRDDQELEEHFQKELLAAQK